MKTPARLIKGDLIYLVSPAKKIDSDSVNYAKEILVEQGFRVEVSPHCKGSHHYFSGTDEERTRDFQQALDRKDIRAILCARGGYGSIRIIGNLNWARFLEYPKWIVGFSDITVFHHVLQNLGVQSIHATMPLNFKDNSKASLNTLYSSLTGTLQKVEGAPYEKNVHGTANGSLLGGNLSIIYSLLATEFCYDFSNKILFIEDLCEQYYHIDRMLISMEIKGVFNEISGLIVGGMTELQDSEFSIGMNLYEIVLEKTRKYDIPVCFNFPCGHIADNQAMIIGSEVILKVTDSNVDLFYTV